MNVHCLPQPDAALISGKAPARSSISQHADPKHKAAARSLCYALTLGDESAWAGFTIVAMSRMTAKERAALAYSTLRAMDSAEAEMTVTAALGESGAGMPRAAFAGVIDEASFWADWASSVELDAYCLASFNRMAPARQAAFLDFVQRKAVA